MHVLSGCEMKRRECLFSQLGSRAKCFFYASEDREKGQIHASMYGMLKGENNPLASQGLRLSEVDVSHLTKYPHVLAYHYAS